MCTLDLLGDGTATSRLHPPIPSWVYETVEDVSEVVLKPRYRGDSFYPTIPSFPFYANLSLITNPNIIVDIVEIIA